MLLCAPSNHAVDLLALRLQAADPALRLLRYGAPARTDAALAGMSLASRAARRVAELEQVCTLCTLRTRCTLRTSARPLHLCTSAPLHICTLCIAASLHRCTLRTAPTAPAAPSAPL